MHNDSWSCLFRCTAKRAMPQAGSPEDHLYTFVNVDSDGTLTQIVEDDYFCEIGDVVRLTLTPTGDQF